MAYPQLGGQQQANDTWLEGLLRLIGARFTDLIEHEPGLANQDPQAVVDLMFSAVPVKHSIDEVVGPFYDTEGLRKWLGVSRQALHDRVTKGTLLSVLTGDNHRLYPAFQFVDGSQLLPALPEIIAILRTGTDSDWTIASWMRGHVAELDGLDVVEYLVGGNDPSRVVEIARDTAERWRS